MSTHLYTLDGKNVTIEHIVGFIANPKARIAIHPQCYHAISRAHNFLYSQMKKKVIYGVNTGFGPMASHIIGTEELKTLQQNLIRSHSTGMGDTIDPVFVLASMVVRLNTLIKGHSGVSRELIDYLLLFINRRIIPVVHEHGAVGTSGDLVQLAHIALALIGEGEVWHEGTRQSTTPLLKKLKIKPHELQPKEGLSLINGTSMMTGIGALNVHHAERVLALAMRLGAMGLELVHAFCDAFSEELHAARPHPGQVQVAARLREILSSSRLLQERQDLQKRIMLQKRDVKEISDGVQDVYSFRCLPQILGPAFEVIARTKETVETEMNSATDNPVIDMKKKQILHGGNFHGDYVAAAMDQMKIGLVKMTLLSERKINFFLNRNVNQHFPPFLNLNKPGLTLALQGLQFVATSTAAQSQSLAYPHSLHSISTNADNQDVVSMGTDAALIVAKVIENAYIVLTIELITLLQAVDILGVERKLSLSSRALYRQARAIVPKVWEDRPLSAESKALCDFLTHSQK